MNSKVDFEGHVRGEVSLYNGSWDVISLDGNHVLHMEILD